MLGQQGQVVETGKVDIVPRSMVSADMDMTQLEAFLSAQSKKRDAPLSEEQISASALSQRLLGYCAI
nr:hypothetical protein BaRGS_020146 [Batillaria attramentaria]